MSEEQPQNEAAYAPSSQAHIELKINPTGSKQDNLIKFFSKTKFFEFFTSF